MPSVIGSPDDALSFASIRVSSLGQGGPGANMRLRLTESQLRGAYTGLGSHPDVGETPTKLRRRESSRSYIVVCSVAFF